jgi:hypothetical protein
MFERVGWIVMAAMICGAAIGVFGNGWLSVVETVGDGELTLRYPRFGRAHTPLDLSIHWRSQDREAVLFIERAYLDHFAIEEVKPPPVAVTVDRERLRYSFRVSNPQVPVAVGFRLRAEHGGRFVGAISVDHERAVGIRLLLFP